MQSLRAYIHSLTDFSEKSWLILQPALMKVEFSKNEYLLKEGQVCNSLFFIEKGYCRCYFEKDGMEKNTSFFFENEVATNITSFAEGQKSAFYIQACEPLTAIVFEKTK
ncbi:MAG TPA: cyclic nucleotide-binding domain-containing protein, partial [Bacteroidales bacterium]